MPERGTRFGIFYPIKSIQPYSTDLSDKMALRQFAPTGIIETASAGSLASLFHG
jgi:hypothetical protein